MINDLKRPKLCSCGRVIKAKGVCHNCYNRIRRKEKGLRYYATSEEIIADNVLNRRNKSASVSLSAEPIISEAELHVFTQQEKIAIETGRFFYGLAMGFDLPSVSESGFTNEQLTPQLL